MSEFLDFAVRAGVSPLDIPLLTPHEISLLIEREENKKNERANLAILAGWTSAVLSRSKRVKDLSEYLVGNEVSQEEIEEQHRLAKEVWKDG